MSLVPCFGCGRSISNQGQECRRCGHPSPSPSARVVAGPRNVVVEPPWRSGTSGPLFARQGSGRPEDQEQIWVGGDDAVRPPMRIVSLAHCQRLEVPPEEGRRHFWESVRRAGPARLFTDFGNFELKGALPEIEGFFRTLGVPVAEGQPFQVVRRRAWQNGALLMGWVIATGFIVRELVLRALRAELPDWWAPASVFVGVLLVWPVRLLVRRHPGWCTVFFIAGAIGAYFGSGGA